MRFFCNNDAMSSPWAMLFSLCPISNSLATQTPSFILQLCYQLLDIMQEVPNSLGGVLLESVTINHNLQSISLSK